MLIPANPLWWLEAVAGYLEFVGAVGWMICAVFAAGFWTPPGTGRCLRRRSPVSLAAATAFLLLAGGLVGALLHQHARTLPGISDLAVAANMCIASGATVLFAIAPLPGPVRYARPRLARTLLILIGTVPLLLTFAHPIAHAWSAIEVYGLLGTWLLVARPAPQPRAKGEIPADRFAGILGRALVTLGAAALASAVLRNAPAQLCARGFVLALGACNTSSAWWRLYLEERTLPPVRRRRGMLGIRLRHLFLLAQVAVLGGGFAVLRLSSQLAEGFAAQRLVDEVQAVASPLQASLAGLPGSPDPGSHQPALDALLAATPGYRAAALWVVGDEPPAPQDIATRWREGAPSTAESFHPQSAPERNAAHAGKPFVRWRSPTRGRDTLMVVTPLASIPGASAPRFLSVLVEAAGLADVVVVQRLQTLAIIGLLALFTSISVLATARAFNETELRALQTRAELENEARNELLAMVSHEVRTPLQSVLGYAELAAADALPPAAERHVRAIRVQGAALMRMVQDILDLSALRSGRLHLQPEPVTLSALGAEVRQALAERARRKGLAFTVDVDNTVPAVVQVDRVRLLQVLLNLTGNAIKFTTKGSVRVRISGSEPAPGSGLTRVELEVADTGPGIPAAQQERVFEPFRKLRDDPASETGVGLGLAICEQIVTSLRGRIYMESTEGRGSTFRVVLDLATARPEAQPAPPQAAGRDPAWGVPAGRALAGLRVLIVDDHPFVRDLLHDFLQRLGAEVFTSADGTSALAAATEQRPDVILLDLKLPDRSPEDLLAELRARAASAEDPWIVGMSAGATELQIQRALTGGMNDFLIKPVSLSGLAETLRLSPAGVRIASVETPLATLPVDPRAATPEERAALLAEIAPAIVRIAHACHIGDFDLAAAESHYLANSCVVLGFAAATAACRAIQKAAESEDPATARDLLGDLRVAIAQAHRGATPA